MGGWGAYSTPQLWVMKHCSLNRSSHPFLLPCLPSQWLILVLPCVLSDTVNYQVKASIETSGSEIIVPCRMWIKKHLAPETVSSYFQTAKAGSSWYHRAEQQRWTGSVVMSFNCWSDHCLRPAPALDFFRCIKWYNPFHTETSLLWIFCHL